MIEADAVELIKKEAIVAYFQLHNLPGSTEGNYEKFQT
jgi:hypothetical protein